MTGRGTCSTDLHPSWQYPLAAAMAFYEPLKRVFHRAWAWFGGREPVVLLSLLLLVGALWLFIEVADEVLEGDTHAFDEWVVQAMRRPENRAIPIGPPWLHEVGRDATALGGTAWLVLFTAVIAGYLWLDRKLRMMFFLLGATTTGLIISFGLKALFSRPRPDIVPHLTTVTTSSFPSGHSMLSSVVYLTLGALLASVITRQKLKVYVISVALVLTLLVGLSRIYLGVHYPTDVLAGWLAGLSWSLLCWLVARHLQRRGQVESSFSGAKQASAGQ